FVRASASQLGLSGTATKTTVVFEAWLKPLRLDGRRMVATKAAPSTSQAQTNWVICTNNGAIEVGGNEGNGAKTWVFQEGSAAGGATSIKRSHSLRVGVWNHLHVTMETSGITVRVNGNIVPMLAMSTLTGAGQLDALGSGSSDAAGTELYLGGLP